RDGQGMGEALGGLAGWLRDAFLHLDLGITNYNGADLEVRQVLLDGLPVDLVIPIAGLVVGVALGLAGGLLCGPGRRGATDHVLSVLAALAMSAPVFLFAYVAIFFFGHITGTMALPFVADTGVYAQPWDNPVEYLRAIATPAFLLSLPVAAQC